MAGLWSTFALASVIMLGMLWTTRVMGVLDVGDNHVCATVGSTLKCWGFNGLGQLGRGDTEDIGDNADEMGEYLEYVDLGSGEIVLDVALGHEFTCVLLESGSVKCFGKNDRGQLGQGDTETRGDEPNQLGDNLTAIDLGDGYTPRAITAGCNHACALMDSGDVVCFGYNSDGQLGQGHTDNWGDDPNEMGANLTAVNLGSQAKAVSAGCDFTCALTESGAVMCWGLNKSGQLGTGTNENVLDQDTDELVEVDLGGDAVHSIAAGDEHVCARLEDASVKCWGNNNEGQLGQGDTLNRGDDPSLMGANLEPIDFGSGGSTVELDCGKSHTCALLDDGFIKCFGSNEYGELGIGSTNNVGDEPYHMGVNLTVVDLGANASAVSAGEHITCARLSDDGVKCWGHAHLGQLGQEDDVDIGTIPGDLAALLSIDLGSPLTTDAPTASPTPAPTSAQVNETTMPTMAPSVSPTAAPLAPGETRAPTAVTDVPATLAPVPLASDNTGNPSATDGDDDAEAAGTNSAPAAVAGGLVTSILAGIVVAALVY